jgi:hypothetical protein
LLSTQVNPAGSPLNDEPSPTKLVAVTAPLTLTPSALAVTAEPTTTELENVPTPVMFIPVGNEGAPRVSLLV